MKTIEWKLKEYKSRYNNIIIKEPEDIFREFKHLFDGSIREKSAVFWLNVKNEVVGFEVLSIGSSTASFLQPKEVFRAAIVQPVESIIIAHNHPSGNCKPSAVDDEITKRIKAAGEILGISLLDHIIFCEDTFYSYASVNRL